MKKEWVKPEIKFITDPDIILDASMKCMARNRSLYGWEEYPAYDDLPFSRMLANNTQGDIRDLEALHQRL